MRKESESNERKFDQTQGTSSEIQVIRPTFLNYMKLWFFNPFIIGLSVGVGHFLSYWLCKQLLKIEKVKSLVY
ncbi:hypothetical protein ABPG74_006516 [Tetrahymena malaccensis]